MMQNLKRLSLAWAALLLSAAVQADNSEKNIAFAVTTVKTTPGTQHMPADLLPQLAVDDLCRQLADKLGSVKPRDCLGKGLRMGGGYSVKGLPLIYKEYPPRLDKRPPLGRVLVLGGIHGDEYSSVSIVFKWLKKLDKYHSGMFHWRVVPVLNPDGLLQSKSQRMNSNGVDLNRNFPTANWHEESRKYWDRTRHNPRRYPGPEPLSEPESRWLAEEIERFKPDAIVAVHAPYGILDFDGPREAPRRLGHLHLNLLGTYPGSLGNYAGVQNRIPVVTIELPYAGIMPTAAQISAIWVDLVRWLQKNARSEPKAVASRDQAGPS